MTTTPFQPPAGFEPDDLFSRPAKPRKRVRPKNIEFIDLPLRKRRDMAVSMGWKIRSYPDGAGEFITHDYIPGDRRWPVDANNALACQWADIFFVGKNHRRTGVFYNTTIETLAQYLVGKVESQSQDILRDRMSGIEQDDTIVYTKKTKLGSVMVFPPHKPIDAFGGMTKDGKRADIIDDLAALLETSEDIRGFTKVEPGYVFGVGQHMVVPEAGLTVEGIARWIRRYRQEGEGELQWECPDRNAVIPQVRSALAYEAWMLRRRQAKDLNQEPPPEPGDLVGKIMVGAASNAIKL